MDIGQLTYNNLVIDKSWTSGKQSKAKEVEKKYLALTTQLVQKMSSTTPNQPDRPPNNKHSKQGGQSNINCIYLYWRYANPDDQTTK